MLIKKAVSLGASDARIISTNILSVEDSIIEMCKSPRCDGFGQCANCPPHAMAPDKARNWIKDHSQALVVKKDLPPYELFGEQEMAAFGRMFLIITTLERAARARGFDRASGLCAGSCKPVLCPREPCAVLQGQHCRYPHLARPSLEALGINVFKLAETVGWTLHKILRDTPPDFVPSASLIGMVLL